MKLGVISRCEDRGLGNQSWEVCRHLDPDRVLLIDTGHDKRFTKHPERFDQWETTVAPWTGGRLDETAVRRWLKGLDVVYSAESPYDFRMGQWCASEEVGLALHANPEFVGPADAKVKATWWSATPWRLDHLPHGARVVPMPAAESSLTHEPGERFRLLHTAGWPAVEDRNGTGLLIEAARLMTAECDLIIRGQHRNILHHHLPRHHPVRLVVECGNVADYWDLYRDADALVMPRRYGGLCLPAHEAMASGLPVVMPDCSPNEIWPGPRVPAHTSASVAARAGRIPLHDVDPRALAATLDDLVTNPDLVAKYRQEAVEWAQTHSWDALLPLWLEELQRASW
jgi:glycosyltransferase involved in cell wall biosynthesis